MDFEEFDVVESEKSKAIRRYLRVRKIGTLIRIAEALCALLFLGRHFSNVSRAVDLVNEFFRRQLGLLATPFSAFVFGNGITLIIFVLSDRGNDCDVGVDGEGKAEFHQVCEQTESDQKSSHLAAEDSPKGIEVEKVEVITTVSVASVNVHEIPKDYKVKPTDIDIDIHIQPGKDEICMAVGGDGEANGPIPCRDESVDTSLLGRIHSDNVRGIPVDDLSDEEFNLQVERYIASKKWMLWEEMLAQSSRGD